MLTPPKAEVVTEPFWPVTEQAIDERLSAQQAGEIVEYGRSVSGRPLRVVRCRQPGAQRLWIVGCVHGHEPGTTAACLNLLHVLEHGEDIKGKPWPEIADFAQQLDVSIVPVANPDARARCPDCYVGWPSVAIVPIGQSVALDGSTVAIEDGLPPRGLDLSKIIFLGGLYSDEGLSFTRALDYDTIQVIEIQQLITEMAAAAPDCCMDLHACGSNVMMMVRSLPDAYRENVRAIDGAARKHISALGHQYADAVVGDTEPEDTGFISYLRIVHKQFGSLAFVYEGRQGYMDVLPHCTAADIIDDYLITIRETMRVGVEQGFRP